MSLAVQIYMHVDMCMYIHIHVYMHIFKSIWLELRHWEVNVGHEFGKFIRNLIIHKQS